jgi:transcriptional regulator with XRE-family HTH domain
MSQRYKADLLRAERGRRDWTKTRLAEESGLTFPTILKVLDGEASYDSVEKVARALGFTMEQIWSHGVEADAQAVSAEG